jgi:hypothetical protein
METQFKTETEASEFLNVRTRTLRVWRCRGQGPKFKKFGENVRYAVRDLEEYAEAATRRSTSDTGSVEVG